MNTHPVVFKIGDENRPIIEDINENILEDSIFSEQYKKALEFINAYVQPIREQECNLSSSFNINKNVDNDNNIFAFIGERGSGKTSCMMSVINLLVKKDKEILNSYENLKERNFYMLDLIDPSFFDDKHNILAIFIAQLYKKYLEKDSSLRCGYDNDSLLVKKKTLLEKFSETQQNLGCILEKPQESMEDLEQLVSLAAAVDLKQNIRELVDAFLDYMGKKESVLLLMIDDIDLHSKGATEMAEQIRKYLIHPNMVITMAVKLDQLAMLKRLQYTKEYEKLLDKGRAMTLGLIEEMTERYLTKLIPHNHRIFLPDAEVFLKTKLKIEFVDNKGDNKGDNKVEYSSIRHGVLELIFQKTRYLFYNTATNTSYIVPRNLRELRLLVTLLIRMPNYRDTDPKDKEKQKQNTYNKQLFKKYFFESWVINHLDIKGQRSVDEILQITDAMQINHRVLKILKDYFPSFFAEAEAEAKPEAKAKDEDEVKTDIFSEVGYIQRDKNMVYNIALGDVLSIIDLLERQYTDFYSLHFLFMLKSIYSMRLYEYYDEVTELKSKQETEDDSEESENNTQEQVLRHYTLKGLELSNYDKLVAGRFINSRIVELLPMPPQSGKSLVESRSNRIINIGVLHTLIQECISQWKSENNNVDNSFMEERVSTAKVQLAEFFMLCISRGVDTKNKDKYEALFRRNRTVYYAESLATKQKNALFDLNSFFYNITRIEECYKRFKGGKEFFDFAQRSKKSLWYAFKEKTIERDHNVESGEINIDLFDQSRWISWCSIRNVEVLQDLQEELENINYNTSSDIDILRVFFAKIASFEIRTYDRTSVESQSYYSIEFKFIQAIVNLLDSSDIKTDFRNIFTNSSTWLIDVDKVTYGRRDSKDNLKKTVIKFICNHYPIYETTSPYKESLQEVFDNYDDKMSKEEIAEAIERLNEWDNNTPATNIPVSDTLTTNDTNTGSSELDTPETNNTETVISASDASTINDTNTDSSEVNTPETEN